jgi:ribokinase
MSSGEPRLTVVGAINVDLVATTSRAPARGETVADGVLNRQPGGKGANQAVAAARLGADVTLIGAVGTDPDGDYLVGSLTETGVDVSCVQRVPGSTGTALIVVDAEGENSIVVCREANGRIDAERVRVGEDSPVLAQLEVDPEIVEAAIAQTTGFVAINASPAIGAAHSILERADLVIVNEHEFEQLPSLREAALVALTLGSAGARLLRHGDIVATAASPAARVRNTVGAGDAFAAALTLGLLRGDAPAVALRRACAVGAAAVEDERSQPLLRSIDQY